MPLDPIEITGSLAIGQGLGIALGDVAKPRLENFRKSQWAQHQDVPLAPGVAAEVAAEEVDLYGAMETQASYSGYDADRFADLYRVTLTAPGVGMLLQMLRREDEAPIDFTRGLRKAKLGDQWDAAIRNLRDERIPAPDLAYMVVRDLVPDPFGASGPTSPDDLTIQDIPQLAIDTLAEAAKTGWDPLRFEALVGRSGLAPAPIFAAQAYFRGWITYDQYKTIIAKGDLRPAYSNVILNGARQILTAGEYTELELRGWYDAATRRKNTAKHGMSDADSDLLFKVLGRPMNARQVFQSQRRGGVYDGDLSVIDPHFLKSLRESNIRPEWYNLEWHYRFTQPGAFIIRQWLRDGHDPAWARLKLDYLGWEASDIDNFITAYAGGTTAVAADPNVKKAHTKAWTEAQASYIAEESTQADVQPIFDLLGVPATAVPDVLAAWDAIRALVRKQLSPKEIKKAYSEGVVNPATGAAWTLADALAALGARGYAADDARTLLEL